MKAKLVGVVGSHPCLSVELMLRYKGIEYTRLDLPNMSHKRCCRCCATAVRPSRC